jgi:hypothetical protein
MKLYSFLAKEICKDLHPNEVYEIAEEYLTSKLSNSSIQDLKEEYEERYYYVFEELS